MLQQTSFLKETPQSEPMNYPMLPSARIEQGQGCVSFCLFSFSSQLELYPLSVLCPFPRDGNSQVNSLLYGNGCCAACICSLDATGTQRPTADGQMILCTAQSRGSLSKFQQD